MTGVLLPILGAALRSGLHEAGLFGSTGVGMFSAAGAYTAVIGDSIDSGSPASASWFNECCRLTGQRMRQYINAGVGGNTTTQMLARINADIVTQSPKPNVCVIGGPTNDYNANIAASVTQQNIQDMVASLRAAGITPAIRNCSSRNTAGTGAYNTVALTRQAILDHNAWLATYCAGEGIALIDIFTPTYDGTGLTASYTADGLHFNAAGSHAAAAYAATRLPGYLNSAAIPYLTTATSDPLNIVPNGIFVGDTNADGIANSWGGTSVTSPSITINDYDGAGNWQNFTTENGVLGFISPGPNPSAVASRVYEAACLVKGDVGKIIKLRIQARDGSNVTVGTFDFMNDWTVQTAGQVQTAFMRIVAPANTATFVITAQGVSTGATGQISVARFTIRDKTTNP